MPIVYRIIQRKQKRVSGTLDSPYFKKKSLFFRRSVAICVGGATPLVFQALGGVEKTPPST